MNSLYTHAKSICALNEKLHNYLDPALSSHCSVANYSAQTLTINSDTSAWASKLRNHIPDILHYAQHECALSKLASIRIKVCPSHNNANTTQSDIPNDGSRKAFISKKSAEFIKNVAMSIQNPALQESFLKISKNVQQP